MSALEQLLTDRLAPAFEKLAGEPADPVIRRSQHADFQADGTLALAKRLERSPRDLAADVVELAELEDICSSVEISGPGFINLIFRDDVLSRLVAEMDDDRLGVPAAANPDKVVVDYSAPNVAKEMHVGHLRSTIIGDATVRVLAWLGHDVVRANHLGDWGTPFGMLIEHLLDLGESEALAELSVGDLNGFYRAAREKFESDESFQERSRLRVVSLQQGDETTRRLWRILVEESQRYFMAAYGALDVLLTEDDFYGESFYNDMLTPTLEDLDQRGLLEESDGAEVVFPDGFTNRDGDPLPLIAKKTDGGFGYATTDLAAIRYRMTELKADRALYVVGMPQRQHLQMIFQAARAAGWFSDPEAVKHVGFGSVLGNDGKIFKSRSGETVKLMDLIDEAITRAAALIAEKDPDLDEQARTDLARAVGIGAMKYADLTNDKIKDYTFDWDRMLSFDGNTAPYVQYARARILSMFRKAEITSTANLGPVVITEPAERELAMRLLAFGGVVTEVGESIELHRLVGYLYSVASTFTTFYDQCPVLRSEGPVRDSRLRLSDTTARVLERGLDLLGIASPDRM